MKTAVYPGSFDPFTSGHLDIAGRAATIFGHLIIAIAVNQAKRPLFSVEERIDMIREVFAEDPRVEIEHFSGLLVDYVRSRKAHAVIRGLRAVSDFEYEFQMANMNHKLHPDMETLFLMTGQKYFYVSSRVVKEVAALGGCVRDLVPGPVHQRLLEATGGTKR